LTRGTILFTGGDQIDPQLNLVAENKIQNYQITATISGTASKPVLDLSSTPELDQADILAMIMFGSPVNQLSGSQQSSLQQQALSAVGGFAASKLGQSVAQALGLQDLGIGMTSTGGVGINRYVTKNTYLSASQQTVGTTQNRQATISYSITPEIELDTSASTNRGNQIELTWHKEY
jgi:translocation and assembly module TamB